MLATRVHPQPTVWIAAVLMTMGLIAKTALFPFHLWLPPAHAGAPAPGSAVLSALVVKGSFFLIVRLWFDAMPGLMNFAVGQVLAGLGAGAVLFGSVLAIRQQRLKLLVAYSTVAQIGYLFFIFPLAAVATAVVLATARCRTWGRVASVRKRSKVSGLALGVIVPAILPYRSATILRVNTLAAGRAAVLSRPVLAEGDAVEAVQGTADLVVQAPRGSAADEVEQVLAHVAPIELIG